MMMFGEREQGVMVKGLIGGPVQGRQLAVVVIRTSTNFDILGQVGPVDKRN